MCFCLQRSVTTDGASRLVEMVKPVHDAIMTHAQSCPVIVYVPCLEQAKQTALQIIRYAEADKRCKVLHCEDNELLDKTKDEVSKSTIKKSEVSVL